MAKCELTHYLAALFFCWLVFFLYNKNRHRRMWKLRLVQEHFVGVFTDYQYFLNNSIKKKLVTLLSAAIILTFMTIEFFDYRRVHLDTSIVVDRSRGEKLTVHMNVSFPHVPCYCLSLRPFAVIADLWDLFSVLSLDVVDISGEQQRDVTHDVLKTRLDPQGNPIGDIAAQLGSDLDKVVAGRGPDYCGSCYGGIAPASGCCNTCEEVRQSYVNRGWSFSNPDAVEQVISLCLLKILSVYSGINSASLKDGRTK